MKQTDLLSHVPYAVCHKSQCWGLFCSCSTPAKHYGKSLDGLCTHLYIDDSQIYSSCHPTGTEQLQSCILVCINDVTSSMCPNRLWLSMSTRIYKQAAENNVQFYESLGEARTRRKLYNSTILLQRLHSTK